MARTKPRQDRIRDAAKAHSDLNIFYGVMALLEGGTISGPASADAERIIRICHDASQKALRRYDNAVAKAIEP